MPTPFDSWLRLYAKNTVPARPWWRVLRSPTYMPDDKTGDKIMGGDYVRSDGARAFAPDDRIDALDAYDDANPIPAPPPMVGQVWSFYDGGSTRTIIETRQVVDVVEQRGELLHRFADNGFMPEWPPPGGVAAVLVAGPTPWGFNIPWAPPGWRP